MVPVRWSEYLLHPWRRWIVSTRPEPGGHPSASGEREPIAILRVDGITEGWIAKPVSRVSDALTEAHHLTVETDASDERVPGAVELDLDDVVAVVPAPRPTSRARVSRRQYAVEIEAGPYRMAGFVHLPVGADPERYVASTGRRWLPLTACRVAAADDEWAADVVIVNLDHAVRKAPYPDKAPALTPGTVAGEAAPILDTPGIS